MKRTAALIVLSAVVLAAGGASAEPDLVSRDTLGAFIDLRLAVADGDSSWVDGGFGKTRYGGDAGQNFKGHASLADAALIWKPRLTWNLGAVVEADVQDEGGYRADLIEAYLTYKPTPRNGTRYSLRAGYFYPPISLEHDGPAWTTTRTLTPSAIDSWVGEELKVLGAEATVTHDFGAHQLSATGAVFGYDDTSGTLLTFRGWGLGDVKGGAFKDFPLPPLEPYSMIGQPPETYPTREIDGKVGFYGKLEWRPPAPITLSAFYYDNSGDLISVDSDEQWAWDTRFWNIGATVDFDDKTHLLSQVMSGETLMGYPNGRSVWYNIGYTSAYALVTRQLGDNALSGRIEYFQTNDRNFRPATDDADADMGETGWALTTSYHVPITSYAGVTFEALHGSSNRPSRAQNGLKPKQPQTLVQTALRLSF